MIDLNEKVEVPNNPGYYINRKGEVFNSSGLKLKPGKHRQGYTNFKLSGKAKYLHRLLAKAFIPNPDKDKVYVNHIDGDVTNNELTNLEWVTSSENAVHAYETGLISSNIPIEAKDLRTGEVLEFRGYRHTAKYFGITRYPINNCLKKRDKARLLLGFYLLRRQNEPWPNYDPNDIGCVGNTMYSPVLLIHQETGKKTVFLTKKDAAKHIGISEHQIHDHLKRNKGKPYRGYIISLINNLFELEELKEKYEYVEPSPRRHARASTVSPIPIEVKDRLGHREVWESAEAFAKAHGVSRETLQASIWRIKGWNGFKIRYLR